MSNLAALPARVLINMPALRGYIDEALAERLPDRARTAITKLEELLTGLFDAAQAASTEQRGAENA